MWPMKIEHGWHSEQHPRFISNSVVFENFTNVSSSLLLLILTPEPDMESLNKFLRQTSFQSDKNQMQSQAQRVLLQSTVSDYRYRF